MASAQSSKLQQFLHKTPLYKKGPICGNYHFFTDRYCRCCQGEYFGDWHGGVYDFKLKKEVSPDLVNV